MDKHKVLVVTVGGMDSIPDKELKTIGKNPTEAKAIILDVDVGEIGNLNNAADFDPKTAKAALLQIDKVVKMTEYIGLLYQIYVKIGDYCQGKISNVSMIKIICRNPEKILLGLVFFNSIIKKLMSISKKDYPELNSLFYLIGNAAGIRGSLSASSFLKVIASILSVLRADIYEQVRIARISLLETATGKQFFFAPVGIDECNNFEKKKQIIFDADKLMNTLNIDPIISILSGGRTGDKGRDAEVDKTLKDAGLLVDFFKNETGGRMNVTHEEILIENAIKRNSNFILAPDGISGNLIYRTLVHLGGGKAYGALYSTIYYKYNTVLIDSSRDGHESEIEGSLKLAAGFATLLKNIE